MSLTISWPLDSTTWRPKGSVEFSLDHVTFGFGLPSAVHFNMAVWLSLTVIPTGRSDRDGAERDCPGSPLAPFTPDGPVSPTEPGLPGFPMSPFVPFGPWAPIGPCLPGGPFRPGFPGGPGFPRVPALPWRPPLPFGPGQQSVWSFAKNWFCSRLSSFLISSCTLADVRFESCCETFRAERFRRLGLAFSSFLISSCTLADVRFESCCETFRAERFCRLGLAFYPSENQRLANEVMWLTIHQH